MNNDKRWRWISYPQAIQTRREVGMVLWFAVCAMIYLLLMPGEVLAMPEVPAAMPAPATNFSGDITSDTTWMLANSPYVLTGYVTVKEGATLTIEPGVEVRLSNWISIVVEGELIAQGTAADPIVITSNTGTSAGLWYQLVFKAGSSGLIEHTWIGYGGGIGTGMISIASNDVAIRHSTVTNGAPGWRANIWATNVSPEFEYNTIANGGEGIHFDGFDATRPVKLTGNTFQGITGAAVFSSLSAESVDISLSDNSSTATGLGGFVMSGASNTPAITGTVTITGQNTFPVIVGSGNARMIIPEGAQLTITPGTTVKFLSYGAIDVYGRLLAPGTADDPVVFTSLQDDAHGGDTNGDGAASAPGAGSWNAIHFWPTSTGNSMSNCWIGYGGYRDVSGMVLAGTSDLTLDRCTLAYAGPQAAGLRMDGTSPTIQNTIFQNNLSWGALWVGLDKTSPLVFTDNTFANNGAGAMYAQLDEEVMDITLTGNSSTGSPKNGFVVSDWGGSSGRRPAISGTVTITGQSAFPLIVGEANNSLTVAAGAQLTLAPGMTIKFSQYQGMDVYGSLRAPGTPTEPIIFTSFQDDTHSGDTNGDGTASVPGPGYWGMIRFWPTATNSLLRNCWIGYGGYYSYGSMVFVGASDLTIDACTLAYSGTDAALRIDQASPTITGSQIHDNGQQGIRVQESGAAPVIEGNIFFNNGDTGLYLYKVTSLVPIQNNQFLNNGRFGVYNSGTGAPLHNNTFQNNGTGVYSTKTIDALYNWWGDASGPHHATKNPSGSGDGIQDDYVLFAPWLDRAPGTPPPPQMLFSVYGPGSVSPGGAADYLIAYTNSLTETVQDAFAVLTLPATASYRQSSGGGVYWTERHQVVWKLGDLAPGASGRLWAQALFAWGTPDFSGDGVIAMIAGRNLNTALVNMDEYLAFTKVSAQDPDEFTEAQFVIQRQAYPELGILYNQAVAEGYRYGLGDQTATEDGDLVIRAIMLNLSKGAVRFLMVSRAEGTRAATFEGTQFTIQDLHGGLTWNRLSDVQTLWGNWGTGFVSPAGCTGAGCCMRNCMAKVALTAVVGQMGKIVDVAMTGLDAYDAYHKGTPEAYKALALDLTNDLITVDSIPVVGAVSGTFDCVASCAGDPNAEDCTPGKDLITCEPSRLNIYDWIGIPSKTVNRCMADGCYNPIPERIPCALDERCMPDVGCVPCVAGEVDCKDTGVQRAHDPNAKLGTEGNLLPGQWVSYTIQYENVGNGRAYGVFVSDELAAEFDDTTVQIGANGTYYPSSRMLSWNIGELAPVGQVGSQGEVTLTVRLKEGLAGGTMITNQATVHFPSVPETTPTNAVINMIQPVVAHPFSMTVESGVALSITLSGAEVSDQPLTFAVIDNPLLGALSGTGPSRTYTALAGFSGLDRFTYTASNGANTSDPAEVTILITPASGDVTPPEVMWTSPSADANIGAVSSAPILSDTVGAAYGPVLMAHFSEALDAATVTAQTVTLTGPSASVTVTVRYDATFRQITIVPRQPLASDAWYTVSMGTGLTDLAGNGMAAEFNWRFFTGDQRYIYLPMTER